MRLRPFRDKAAYAATIDRWVARAVQARVELVVFPEDVGLPLMLLSAKRADGPATASAPSTSVASGKASALRTVMAMVKEHIDEIRPIVEQTGGSPLEALGICLARRTGPTYQRVFAEAARRHRVFVAAGSCPIVQLDGSRPRVYNAGYVFDRSGRLLSTTLKVNPIPLERTLIGISPAKGHAPPVVSTPIGRVGMAICYDCYFPELIAGMGGKGMQILVDPRADPGRWTEEQARISRATGLWQRVQENACYGIECFAVGGLLGIRFEGRTQIIAPAALTPDGRGVLAQARTVDHEELVVADLDLAALNRFRRSSPFRGRATTE